MPTVSHSWNASVADEVRRNLACQHDDGNGIHQRIGETRYGIRRAGTGSHQHDARLAGRARIAFGRMHRALLVAHQHMDEIVVGEQRIVDRQHGAAGIAEDMLDALIFQRAHHHLGTGELDGARSRHSHRLSISIHRKSPSTQVRAKKAKGAFPPLECTPPSGNRGSSLVRKAAF